MHESLLKGKAFSSRFWGWGRNRSLPPPLPGTGPLPTRPRPGHTGDSHTGDRGGTQGASTLPSAPPPPHCPSRPPPAASTTHSRPYRDRPLMSRHAERLSGRAGRPCRIGGRPARDLPAALSHGGSAPGLPPARYLGFSILPAAPPAPGQGPCSFSRFCGTGASTGERGVQSAGAGPPLVTERSAGHPGGSPGRGRGGWGREGSPGRVIGGVALAPVSRTGPAPPGPRHPSAFLSSGLSSEPKRGAPSGPLLPPPPAGLPPALGGLSGPPAPAGHAGTHRLSRGFWASLLRRGAAFSP